jgi:hypothetical protein
MNTTDFTSTIVVDKTPQEVFEVLKDVRGWWSGLFGEAFEGPTDQLNESFTFWAGEGVHYTKQKLIELIPDKKIVWEVTDSRLTFVDKQNEWTGTKISFDITPLGNKTEIVFTHIGLVPEFQCYDSCAPAWTQYVQQQLVNKIQHNGNK